MLFARIVDTSARVTATRSRLAKVEALAQCLREMAPQEIEIGVGLLTGEPRQGRLGIGYALLRAAMPAEAAPAPSLTLAELDRSLSELAATAGAGSATRRRELIGALLARATRAEQEFAFRLLLGELRQGALEGIMADAVARAAAVPADAVRRAAMLGGSLAQAARAALVDGAGGLDAFSLRLFQPVQPMLALPADDISAVLHELGTAALEWKLDGARIQAHKSGDEVRLYTRSLNDVTHAAPEVAQALRQSSARELIADGEVIALRPDGAPHAFQTTMSRFGRKQDVARLRETLPLSAFFFDCMRRDDDVLIDAPAAERFRALSDALPARLIVPRLITGDRAEAQDFMADALARGHEGVMAKSLAGSYEAGRRGSSWLKLKRANTLDLVVLAAEWGHGRRTGLLSNLHLGARDALGGGFVMLGKTFKGMTDEMLAWQTQRLLALELARDAWTVHVRPELVVEIAFNEIQASPRYPGGLALRFARVKRYRTDKRAEQADTIDAVRTLAARQMHAAADR